MTVVLNWNFKCISWYLRVIKIQIFFILYFCGCMSAINQLTQLIVKLKKPWDSFKFWTPDNISCTWLGVPTILRAPADTPKWRKGLMVSCSIENTATVTLARPHTFSRVSCRRRNYLLRVLIGSQDYLCPL